MKQSLYTLAILLFVFSCGKLQKEPEEIGFIPVEVDVEERESSSIGEIIDSLHGVPVYYNGYDILHTVGRHKSADGYNYGLKWQCVEFVKRYYFDHLNHRMPNTWGHARDFFNLYLTNGVYNADRALFQWRNGSERKPRINDILVFGGDRYGHVAIISKVGRDSIEITQQNVGKKSRSDLKLTWRNDRWYVRHSKVLGWLSRSKE
ncbi:MAG: CHAP domain-containing protein [Bacteroidota bacterium]